MGDGNDLGGLKQCFLPWLSTGVAPKTSKTPEAQVAPHHSSVSGGARQVFAEVGSHMLEAEVFTTENEVLLVAFSHARPLI